MKLRFVAVALVGALVPALVGCVALLRPQAAEEAPTLDGEPGDWVIVVYESGSDDDALAVMDALFETEVEADEALVADGLGWIDGNEVGQDSYDLYFNGYEYTEMWAVLEPILARAPVSWTRVELRDDLEGDPAVELMP